MYRTIDACARVAALAGKRVVAGPKDLVHLHNKLSQILRVLEEADSRGFISRGKYSRVMNIWVWIFLGFHQTTW